MEMLERILATLIGFVVMVVAAVWLTVAIKIPPCVGGPIAFTVFLVAYRTVRFGAQQLRERQ